MSEIELLSQGSQYVVGWGTLALLNAGIAQGKGKSGLNWFLFSLILSPIATLLLLFIEQKKID